MAEPSLATAWFASFLMEEDEVVDQRTFPQDPAAIADRLATIRQGGILDEERELAGQVDEVLVPSRRLLALGNASIGPPAGRLPAPEDHGYATKLLKEASIHMTREAIRDGLADTSSHMMQAVSYLDESFEVENLLGERLVAWVTLHAPEIVDDAEDHGGLARKLLAHDTLDQALEAADVEDTLGAAVDPTEEEAMRALARAVLEQVKARNPLERFIESTTREMAPNVVTLVGPTITARLIHQAGGLTELAKMPSSTVQTLGAEKALFRHFTEGAPPPKHGVIFQHPLVHRAHPNDRGSIARALAGKITIAARVDAFGDGKRIGEELKGEVQRRAKEVSRVGRRRAMKRRDQGGN